MAVVQHGHGIGYESRLRTEGKSHLPNKDSPKGLHFKKCDIDVNYKGDIYVRNNGTNW